MPRARQQIVGAELEPGAAVQQLVDRDRIAAASMGDRVLDVGAVGGAIDQAGIDVILVRDRDRQRPGQLVAGACSAHKNLL